MSHSDPAAPDSEGAGASTEQRLAEVIAAYRALQAENDSYRERVSRNAERRFAQRHERLLLKFIDILDNLDRALDASGLGSTGGSMIEGLILVRTQLLQTLQEEGLERIPVMGIPYDPEVAEAVGTQPVDDPDHHHIVMKDIRRGYRLKGKLARAAQVIVGEYQGELPTPGPDPGPEEDSGRVDVLADGDETTGEIEALAAQAAAAVEGGRTVDLSGEDDADAETTDAVLEDDAAEETDDTDLETAAREAAALAEGGENEVPIFADDTGEVPVFAADEADGGTTQDGEIADADSLEAAAREAAALVGGDAAAVTAPEPDAETAGDPEKEKKARPRPLHPLEEVDPSAFEDGGTEGSD